MAWGRCLDLNLSGFLPPPQCTTGVGTVLPPLGNGGGEPFAISKFVLQRFPRAPAGEAHRQLRLSEVMGEIRTSFHPADRSLANLTKHLISEALHEAHFSPTSIEVAPDSPSVEDLGFCTARVKHPERGARISKITELNRLAPFQGARIS